MAFGQYLCLGGTPLINTGQLQQFLGIGMGPEGLECRDFEWCSDLNTALGFATGYNPAESAWYDPAEPESANFAGLLVTSITGLEPGDFVRPVVEKAGIGAILGQGRQNAPQITVTALLMASTCEGMEFGYRWLRKALKGSCMPNTACAGDDLVFLSAMPNFPDLDCGASDYAAYLVKYFRTFKGAALVDGPKINSIVARGCPSCYDCGIYEVIFTLSAADPCMYRDPVTILDGAGFTLFEDTDCIEWVTDDSCADDPDCPTDTPCSTDPNCQDVVSPPTMPTLINNCVNECIPAFFYRAYVEVPDGSFPAAAEGTLILSIYAGDEALTGIDIKVWENPLARTPDELNDCDTCAWISVSYVAPGATLVIDGGARTATINCTNGTSQRANPFIAASSGSANFSYPTFVCGSDYMVQVSARPTVSALASVTVQSLVREC